MIGGGNDQLLGDLLRVGIIVENDDTFAPVDAVAARSLELFSSLLLTFDIRLVPVTIPECPVKFCSGILKSTEDFSEKLNRRVPSFPAGGQGYSSREAAFGCIGEIAERLSLCSLGQEDPRVVGLDTSQHDLDFGAVAGFSRAQIMSLKKKRADLVCVENQTSIDWRNLTNRRIVVRNLHTDRSAQLPAYGALFNEPLANGSGIPGLVSSVGAAVWSDLNGARERALLELIERDAVAQAWYNRLGINSPKLEFVAELLPNELINFLQPRQRTWSLAVVETDLPVHVVVSLSYLENGRMTAFGASAKFDFASAVQGAVFEMLQAEYALELMDKSYADGRWGTVLPNILEYGRTKSILDNWTSRQDRSGLTNMDAEYSYDGLLDVLRDKNISVWEFNATRPDLQVPCIKLFSPELCTWQPRFGKSRLFSGVVERGLRSAPALEEEFAARPFPF